MGTEILEKYKRHIINLLVLFVFAFIAVQIYKDQSQKIAAVAKQKQDQTEKNALLEQISQQESQSAAIISAINNKDVTQSLSVLSGLAKQSDILITSIRPENLQNLPFYTKHIFMISVQAPSFHSVAGFISLLESHPNIYMVDQVSFQPSMDAAEDKIEKIMVTFRVSTVVAQSKAASK